MGSLHTTRRALLAVAGLLAVLAVAKAASKRKRRRANRIARAKSVVRRCARVLLAIDIGSSSVRCSAYTVGSSPVLVPGCAAQIKHAVVREDGTAQAEDVIALVDTAVDKCFGELRAREGAYTVVAVGFACFGMNLVGVGADGKPCTPVFTYAGNSSSCSPSRSLTGGSSTDCPTGCSPEDDVMKWLRESMEKTGSGGKGGLEEARRRTGAPTHVSYAPVQLLRWLRASTAAREREGEGDSQKRRRPQWLRVKVWQTLPGLVAARWCCLGSSPVSYSEASWMGLLDTRRLEWDVPTLSILSEAGFDCSALPRLADIGDFRACVSGFALKRWPELKAASIRLALGDGAAACLGSGCDETSGLIAITAGTSAAARVVLRVEGKESTPAAMVAASTSTDGAASAATVAATAETAVVDDLFQIPKGLFCYRLDRHRVVLGGALTDGGSVFEWLRRTLALSPGEDMKAVMEEVERMPPASHGLVILPFFSGERSPGYNDNATACILGLRRTTTRPQLVRAGLESVCLRLAAIVDLMTGSTGSSRGSGAGVNAGEASRISAGASLGPHKDMEVVASGNAFAASPFWRKLLADCLGRTVRASGAIEETSLGVAIMLSSLESEALPQAAAAASVAVGPSKADGELASTEGTPAGAGVTVTVTMHTPDDTSFRAYQAAALAQKRAYQAIYGDADGTGSHTTSSGAGVGNTRG